MVLKKKKLPQSKIVLDESLEEFYHKSLIHSKKSLTTLVERQARIFPADIHIVRSKAEEKDVDDEKEQRTAASRRKPPKDALDRNFGKSEKELLRESRMQWTKGAPDVDVHALLREAEEADRRSALALKEAEQTVEKVARQRSTLGGSSRSARSSIARAHNLEMKQEEVGVYQEEGPFVHKGMLRDALQRAPTGSAQQSHRLKSGKSRPHSAMDSTIISKQQGQTIGNWLDAGHVPSDLLAMTPYAVPFRGNSASMATRALARPRPRPKTAVPFQWSKPVNDTMSLEERFKAMADAGTVHHRHFSDVSSPRQTRAGYGKQGDWNETIKKALEPVMPRRIVDRIETRKNQAEVRRDIQEAAAAKPKPVPISFEPQHTALPAWSGNGSQWAYHALYLPKTLSRWNPGNRDAPAVNPLTTKPSWFPLGESN